MGPSNWGALIIRLPFVSPAARMPEALSLELKIRFCSEVVTIGGVPVTSMLGERSGLDID